MSAIEISNIMENINTLKTEKENRLNMRQNCLYDGTLYKQILYHINAIEVMKMFNDQQLTINRIQIDLDELKEKYWFQNASIEDIAADYDQAIDDLEHDKFLMLYILASEFGLENLIIFRRFVGKEITTRYRLQKEHYDLQKERYERCKKEKHFEPEDRDFINENRDLNEQYKQEWLQLSGLRDMLCELILVLDPKDQDIGFDEDE